MQIINLDNNVYKNKSEARLVLGQPLGLKDTINVFHPQLVSLHDALKSQDWHEAELNMEQDRLDLENAPQSVKELFSLNIAYQFELDSLLSETYSTLLAPFVTDSQYSDMLSIIQYNECLTPEHEVLTTEGWKPIDLVNVGDSVLQYDNGALSFAPVSHTISKEIDDDIIIFQKDGKTIQEVTQGHRMPAKQGGKVSFTEAHDIIYHMGNSLPISGLLASKGRDTLSDKEKMLIEFSMRGGYGFDNDIVFVISNASERIKFRDEVLLALPYSFTSKINKLIVTIPYNEWQPDWAFLSSWLRLDEVGVDWCKAFLKYATRGYSVPYRSNPENLALFQTIAHLCGYSSRIIEGEAFLLAETELGGGWIEKHYMPYNGMVHCVTVPSGAFLTRLGDVISVTGNCLHYRSYLFTIRKVFSKPDDIFELVNSVKEIQGRSEVTFKVLEELKEAGAKYTLGLVENDQQLFNIVFKGIFAFYILEKFNFMSSFATTFIIPEAFNGLMMNSSKQVQKIAQDELLHWQAGEYVILSLLKDDPRGAIAFEQCREELESILEEALQAEYRWSEFILDGREVVGLNTDLLKEYVDWNMKETKRTLGLYNGPKEEMPLAYIKSWLDLDSVQQANQEASGNNYLLNTVVNDLDEDLELDF